MQPKRKNTKNHEENKLLLASSETENQQKNSPVNQDKTQKRPTENPLFPIGLLMIIQF